MSLQNDLKSALIDFLSLGNDFALGSIIKDHPEIITSSYGEYPDCHRIVDVCLEHKHYRICRQISAGEKLTVSSIDEALDDLGVPIWLDGDQLIKWAKSEEDNPSDGPIDWEIYR